MTSETKQKTPHPPNPFGLALVFVALGALLSFVVTDVLPRELGARKLGVTATSAVELAPMFFVLAIFLLSYQVLDVLGAGLAQHAAVRAREVGVPWMPAHLVCHEKLPKSVIFAQRAQMNQVEQAPFFWLAAFSAAIFISPPVAAVASLAWVLVRIQYGRAYRSMRDDAKVGSLGSYTIPAYMISGALAASIGVHAVRLLVV